MDFEVGRSSEHRWLCLNCPEPVFKEDVENSLYSKNNSTHDQFYWAGRIKRGLDKSPFLNLVSNAMAPFALTLTLFFACTENLRDFTAVPLLFFVMTHALMEHIPLTYFPNGGSNAITNSRNKYRGAGRLVFHVFICIVALSLGSELLNQYFNEVDLCTSNLTERRDRVVKRICSVTLFAIPLIYVMYLRVSSSFTEAEFPLDPRGTTNGKSNTSLVEEFITRELPKDNPNARIMQKMWQKRKKLKVLE